MRLLDIMSRNVKTITSDESADEAFSQMKAGKFHHLVVVDDRKHVVGVVSDRDLGGRGGAAARRNQTVADVMTAEPATAGPEMTVREAANLLRGRSIGCLPIVEKNRVVGIITTTDMLAIIGHGGMIAPGGSGRSVWKPTHREDRFPHVASAQR